MSAQKTSLFRRLFDYIPEAVFVCNENGNVLFINQLAAKRIGITSKEIDEIRFSDFDSVLKDGDAWKKMLSELKAFGTMTYQSSHFNRKAEVSFPVEVNVRLFAGDDENWLIVSCRDIHKRVETEKALALSKAVIEQSSKLARVGGWDLDLVNQKLYWTDMTREIHEVPEDYEPDFQTAIYFYKEGASRNFMIADMTAAIQHGAPLGIAEVELVTAKGRTIWVRCVGEVVRQNGQCVRVYGSIQDIDEQKRMELKLEESLHMLERLTRNVPGAVYQLEMDPDETMHCPFISAGVRKLFPELDIPQTTTLDNLLEKMVHPDDRAEVKEAILQSAANLEPFDFDHRQNLEQPNRHIQTSARPEAKENGTVVWHGYMWDISERRKRREELKHFAEVTSEQNKRLLNFTYIVSHNIRSHVANLLGILNILQTDDQEAKETFVPLMQDSVNNLDESLRNLNDIVNIQTQINLTSKPIELHSMVEKTILNLKLAISGAQATVHNNVPKDFVINTNVAYLDSILLNLISNAIKYRSPDRSAEVHIDVESNGHETILSVRDNGLGIDLEKHRNLIFGMYKTFHKNKDAKGLGLFITKTQVESLGGKIDLESEVNKGTTVRVYFYE